MLWGCVAGTRGVTQLRWWEDRSAVVCDVSLRRRFLRAVEMRGVDHELEVTAAPRHPRQLGVATDEVWCTWVRVETKKAAEKLERFRPAPTIVLREGDSVRRVAFWAMSRRHSVGQAHRANKRLAHALGAAKKWADPDEFRFAPCGCFLRDGRARPVPVLVESCSGAIWAPRQVYGRLRDAPDPDAWRERQAA